MNNWHECGSQCESIHRNLIAKIMLLIISVRTTQPAIHDNNSSPPVPIVQLGETPPIPYVSPIRGLHFTRNKWFHLDLDEDDCVREEIRRWSKNWAVAPTLLIECYLDIGDLLSAENEELTLLLGSQVKERLMEVDKEWMKREGLHGIVLETWKILFKKETDHVDLADVYKKAIVLVRSIYSLIRVLPTHRLYQYLQSIRPHFPNPLRLKVRIASFKEDGPSLTGKSQMIGLDKSILNEGTFEPCSHIMIGPLVTPHGELKVQVSYRRECRFRLESKHERLMGMTNEQCDINSSFENVELYGKGSPMSNQAIISGKPQSKNGRQEYKDYGQSLIEPIGRNGIGEKFGSSLPTIGGEFSFNRIPLTIPIQQGNLITNQHRSKSHTSVSSTTKPTNHSETSLSPLGPPYNLSGITTTKRSSTESPSSPQQGGGMLTRIGQSRTTTTTSGNSLVPTVPVGMSENSELGSGQGGKEGGDNNDGAITQFVKQCESHAELGSFRIQSGAVKLRPLLDDLEDRYNRITLLEDQRNLDEWLRTLLSAANLEDGKSTTVTNSPTFVNVGTSGTTLASFSSSVPRQIASTPTYGTLMTRQVNVIAATTTTIAASISGSNSSNPTVIMSPVIEKSENAFSNIQSPLTEATSIGLVTASPVNTKSTHSTLPSLPVEVTQDELRNEATSPLLFPF